MSYKLLDDLTPTLRRTVENVRAAAARLWERPAHRYAVDHGPAHAERVSVLLEGLTEGLMQRHEHALTPEEIVILLSAVHLHAIGLQAEQLEPDAAARWERYPELGAELIYRALESPDSVDLGLMEDPTLVEMTARVVAAQRETTYPSDAYADSALGQSALRPRLLAALLHLAVGLDLDARRVDLEQLKLGDVDADTALDWWLHYYVSGVQVQDEYIRITYRVPQAQREAYEALLPELVESQIRNDFDALRDIFRLHGIKAAIAAPSINAMRTLKPLPAAIWNAAECRLAALRGVKPEPAALPELVATVQGLLGTMGYNCAATCGAAAPAPDLWCFRSVSPSGGLRPPLLVGCQIDGPLTQAEVAHLVGQLAPTEQGYLVVEARVLDSARQAAEATGGRVRVFTLSAFYRELLDFQTYAQRLVDDYEGSALARVYVDLGAVRTTYDARGQAVGEDHFKPLDAYVDIWLKERGGVRNHLSLLGEYGAGKTSFCRQYAAKQARRWLADPDGERLPLLITLREYTKTLDVEALITAALVNEYGIQGATFAAFARFNADRKLLLLFDGFDEMAQRTGARTAVENFWELARVVTPGSKVLLTSRTHYFRTHHEAEALLHGRGVADADWNELGLPTADDRPLTGATAVGGPPSAVVPDYIDLRDRPNFEVLHLEPFSDDDIQAVLRKRFPEEWEQHWTQIQTIYNLPDLARRPVLLEMIMQTLPQLRVGQTLNAAQLYRTYMDLWLQRDVGQGRVLLTPEQRRTFAEALAWELFQRDAPSLHFSQLAEQVAAHFGLADAEQLDYFAADVRTCNFLNRDAEGHYAFAHRSFMEFFVACRLHQLLLKDQATVYGPVKINEEIRLFIHGLLALEPKVEPGPPCDLPPDSLLAGFVWVPPGEFILGGPDGLAVQIARLDAGCFIGKYPVTNAEYARFVAVTRRPPPDHWQGQTPPRKLVDHPVVNVSWQDAVAYCEWLERQLLVGEDTEVGARHVRLPSEQEWEKAARGADGRVYPWGDAWDAARCNTMESELRTTTPIGAYAPQGAGPYGAGDQAGNVWEWTASEQGATRVLRGGAFLNDQDYARCAFRSGDFPYSGGRGRGFRVCVVSRQE